MKLVLTIIELVRQLMERQALRRVDEGDLSDDQVEELGVGLMRLEEAMTQLREQFDLTVEDLNLDLGPLGHPARLSPLPAPAPWHQRAVVVPGAEWECGPIRTASRERGEETTMTLSVDQVSTPSRVAEPDEGITLEELRAGLAQPCDAAGGDAVRRDARRACTTC